MRLREIVFGLITGGVLLTPLASSAGTVTDLVTFSAGPFTATGGSVPVNPVTGSFTITFDPTQTYVDSTSGITSDSLNIALGSALAFDYSPTAQTIGVTTYTAGELVVGGVANGAGQLAFPSGLTDDFWLFINTFATTPTFFQVGYTQVSAGDNLFYTPQSSTAGSVSVAPVPLPPAAWLLLSGLGGLAFLGRKRQSSSTSGLPGKLAA